jgi:hypothetical protein
MGAMPKRSQIDAIAPRCRLVRGEEALASRTTLGAKAGAPLDLAGLFVEFADPHFLFDSASLHQFAKAADGLLGRFLVT